MKLIFAVFGKLKLMEHKNKEVTCGPELPGSNYLESSESP